MGQIPSSRIITLTDADVQRMSDIEFGGPALVAWDQTGNDSVLPSRDPVAEVNQLLYDAAFRKWAATKAFDLETQQLLGTFTEYVWTYAQVSAAPTFLPWSTVSGVRPSNDGQILLFVGGQLIKDYTVSATGITLGTALTTGQSAHASIMSAALAESHVDLVYLGSSGTGAGHKTWAIQSLDPDIYGTNPVVPTAATKCFVFLNGLRQIKDVGYTITLGSGTCSIVFLEQVAGFEVQDDDYVTFLVWSE